MRPPIHSVKHIVQYPIDPIAAGTRQIIELVKAVESTVANTAQEVAEGSVIKAVYVELWLENSLTDGEEIVTITKDPLNATGPTFTDHGNLFIYANKKNILFTHQGLSTTDNNGPPNRILSNWIKIPKGKQRFGLGDKLNLNISNVSSGTLNRCGMSIYKEYS